MVTPERENNSSADELAFVFGMLASHSSSMLAMGIAPFHNLSSLPFFRASIISFPGFTASSWKPQFFCLPILPLQPFVFHFFLCRSSSHGSPCFRTTGDYNNVLLLSSTLPHDRRQPKFSSSSYAVARRPGWHDAKRFRASAGKDAGGTKFQHLKDLPRKRLRNLSKPTSLVDVETGNAHQESCLKEQREEISLGADQAVGQIVSAQANFMRVIVEKASYQSLEETKGNLGEDTHRMTKQPKEENSGESGLTLEGKFSDHTTTRRLADFSNVEDVTRASADENNKTRDPTILPALQFLTEISEWEKHAANDQHWQEDSPKSCEKINCNKSYCHTNNQMVKDSTTLNPCPSLDAQGGTGIELLCVVRALLKKINQQVMVGDRVLVSGIDWTDRRGMIERVFERKTEVLDPPVANVDQMLVLFSMDKPRLEPMTLSRFLVEAESTGIPFRLVLNKSDLVTHMELDAWEDKLLSWGYKPLFCSVNTLSGLVPLCELLKDRTTIIIGPSGVGKSSLINAIGDKVGIKSWTDLVVKHLEDEEPEEMASDLASEQGSQRFEEQMVGEVSKRTGRGKHTTRNVTLLKLPIGGYLADTPGFSLPGLTKVTSKSLATLFPEVKAKLSESESGCTFSDCLHVGEPNCVVGQDWERNPYYAQLLEEVKRREEIQLKTFGTKRESKMRYKVRAFGIKQAEPKLNPIKHRRPSRQKIRQQLTAELLEEVEYGIHSAVEELSEPEET